MDRVFAWWEHGKLETRRGFDPRREHIFLDVISVVKFYNEKLFKNNDYWRPAYVSANIDTHILQSVPIVRVFQY